jgi:hypothetical protein
MAVIDYRTTPLLHFSITKDGSHEIQLSTDLLYSCDS